MIVKSALGKDQEGIYGNRVIWMPEKDDLVTQLVGVYIRKRKSF